MPAIPLFSGRSLSNRSTGKHAFDPLRHPIGWQSHSSGCSCYNTSQSCAEPVWQEWFLLSAQCTDKGIGFIFSLSYSRTINLWVPSGFNFTLQSMQALFSISKMSSFICPYSSKTLWVLSVLGIIDRSATVTSLVAFPPVQYQSTQTQAIWKMRAGLRCNQSAGVYVAFNI